MSKTLRFTNLSASVAGHQKSLEKELTAIQAEIERVTAEEVHPFLAANAEILENQARIFAGRRLYDQYQQDTKACERLTSLQKEIRAIQVRQPEATQMIDVVNDSLTLIQAKKHYEHLLLSYKTLYKTTRERATHCTRLESLRTKAKEVIAKEKALNTKVNTLKIREMSLKAQLTLVQEKTENTQVTDTSARIGLN